MPGDGDLEPEEQESEPSGQDDSEGSDVSAETEPENEAPASLAPRPPIDPQVAQVISQLPPELLAELGSAPPGARAALLFHQQRIAPLPPPEEMRAYEEICPGSADRLIRLMEVTAKHHRVSTRRSAKHTEEIMTSVTRRADRSVEVAYHIVLAAFVLAALALQIGRAHV